MTRRRNAAHRGADRGVCARREQHSSKYALFSSALAFSQGMLIFPKTLLAQLDSKRVAVVWTVGKWYFEVPGTTVKTCFGRPACPRCRGGPNTESRGTNMAKVRSPEDGLNL
ncbi:hypothetical protein ACU8KH_04252 [Lachancea thermotolerans]